MKNIMDFDWQLARAGSDYYLAARFAMKAQRLVQGNLFHAAVEMLLKSGLARKGHTEAELKGLGHSLDKLWQAFKTDYSDPALARHDTTVSSLDKFKDIRYPPDHSFAVSLQWGEPTNPSQLPANTKLYAVLVSDIGALVAEILKTVGLQAGLLFQGINPSMLDALTFLNDQKEYLRNTASGLNVAARLTGGGSPPDPPDRPHGLTAHGHVLDPVTMGPRRPTASRRANPTRPPPPSRYTFVVVLGRRFSADEYGHSPPYVVGGVRERRGDVSPLAGHDDVLLGLGSMLLFGIRHPDDGAQEPRDAEVIDQVGDRERLLARDHRHCPFFQWYPRHRIIPSFSITQPWTAAPQPQ
jgi:hypothetical protein